MDTHGRDEYLFKLRLTEVEFDYPLPQKKNHQKKNNNPQQQKERRDGTER